MVNDIADAVNDLGQIVRRHIGRHSDRDAGRAIDQHSWESAGQHLRLLAVIVEVRHKIDGILLDIRHHIRRHLAHARLGITVCRRGVAVDGAEVAVAVDHRITQ